MDHKIRQKLSQAEQRRILGELDQVAEAHAQWMGRSHNHLVCGTPLHEEDGDEESYLYCDVGRWLYQVEHPWLMDRDDFLQLARSHQAIHELGARLCAKRWIGCRANWSSFLKKKCPGILKIPGGHGMIISRLSWTAPNKMMKNFCPGTPAKSFQPRKR